MSEVAEKTSAGLSDLSDKDLFRKLILATQDGIAQAIADGRFVEFDFEANLTHEFFPGGYMRTLKFPKGQYLVGKIHKHAHPNMLLKGEVLVVTEGGGIEHLVAPARMILPPGTKRLVCSLEDSEWTTIHITDETDLAKIEDHVIAPTYEAYEQFRLEQTEMKQIQGEVQ